MEKKLLVKFIMPAAIAGWFVHDYGHQVEDLEMSPIENVPYNKNKPKKMSKGNGRAIGLFEVGRNLAKSKGTFAAIELRDALAAKNFERKKTSSVITGLLKQKEISRIGKGQYKWVGAR